ncbi:MAG: tetratricopeptide repeat-containing protein [Deltaproteobacteria bacterium]|nr:tetratricopeptide repeat-containing protein [Deltaproteobacteria bacterium]
MYRKVVPTRLLTLAATLWTALALAPDLAAAQAVAPADAPEADTLAREATRRFKEGDYEVAARLFERCYALDHRADRLFNAARAWEKAGRDREAVALFERYLAVSQDPVGREEARVRLARARERAAAVAEPPPVAAAPPTAATPTVSPGIDEPPKQSAKQPVQPVATSAVAELPSRWPAGAVSAAGLILLAAGGYGWFDANAQDETLSGQLARRNTAGSIVGITEVAATAKDQEISQARTWSAVAGGVGIAAVGLGLWWWFEAAPARPPGGAWQVVPTATGASVATWF